MVTTTVATITSSRVIPLQPRGGASILRGHGGPE